MSRLSIALLYTVICGIIVGMWFEVPYVSGNTGALIVIALVYAFVVAKREVALIMHAIEQQGREEVDQEPSDQPVIPEWLASVPGKNFPA